MIDANAETGEESEGPRVAVIGGGSGRFTLLEGLRDTNARISAIVTMMDSGGSSGRLKSELGVLPPGDVRQCLVALSTSPRLMLDLFNYRFAEGSSLSGHNFGNLFLTALEKTAGGFERAVEECERILAIRGRVIPVTLDKTELCAELEDGSVIEGETNIDIPKKEGRSRIRRVFLNQPAKVSYKAADAILDADLVVIGPGDLYTSIIPNLLVDGMRDALCSTQAKKVFVLPLATKRGETDGFSPADFVLEIEKYCGCEMNCVVSNSTLFPQALADKYAAEGAKQVICGEDSVPGRKVVQAKLLSITGNGHSGVARHEKERIASAVLSCLEQ